jgi:hypothetical protein
MTVLNRLETPGLRQERLKLETEEIVLTPAEIVETALEEEPVVEQAELTQASALLNKILFNPEVITKLEEDKFKLDPVENLRIEFLAFRDQVIRSFKFLGLDVRKHFGV